MDIEHPHLRWYIDNGFFYVRGFCKRYVAEVLDLFESSPYNKKGQGVAEIGIECGRLYILLNRTVTNEAYKSYAIDLFGDQTKNVDNSGKGNKEVFLNNLIQHDLYEGRNTVIVEGDSTDSKLNLESLIAPGSLKYISIDGGHRAEHVMNDLKLAEKWIDNEGVVLVDDIMHDGWVGVIQGTLKYLSLYPTLQPFAIGYNKLWMCKVSMRDKYTEMCENSILSRKTPQTFGTHTICTFHHSGDVTDGA